MFEILDEAIYDLLSENTDAGKQRTHTRVITNSEEIEIEGLTEKTIENEQQIIQQLQRGLQSQKDESHTFSCLYVFLQISPQDSGVEHENCTRLLFVEWRGSEKVETPWERTSLIGGSVPVFKRVVQALTSERNMSVPFRDSKATHLLQDSLAGPTHLTFLYTCSSQERDLQETANTLQVANECAKIPQLWVRTDSRIRTFTNRHVVNRSPVPVILHEF